MDLKAGLLEPRSPVEREQSDGSVGRYFTAKDANPIKTHARFRALAITIAVATKIICSALSVDETLCRD